MIQISLRISCLSSPILVIVRYSQRLSQARDGQTAGRRPIRRAISHVLSHRYSRAAAREICVGAPCRAKRRERKNRELHAELVRHHVHGRVCPGARSHRDRHRSDRRRHPAQLSAFRARSDCRCRQTGGPDASTDIAGTVRTSTSEVAGRGRCGSAVRRGWGCRPRTLPGCSGAVDGAEVDRDVAGETDDVTRHAWSHSMGCR